MTYASTKLSDKLLAIDYKFKSRSPIESDLDDTFALVLNLEVFLNVAGDRPIEAR
ncbi:hypothetical protein [Chamaesiphon polymorphus]|uniref:hypothetical protein n=1 Tax=Chamaesiphon polymorphus TaxID=2107691 RepID=UPI0015E728F5|nr:hypothetical protein [Chamaesiphon polymorphus]